MRSYERLAAPDQTAPTSASGQKQKSKTAFLMSAKPPKAEVARRWWHFRYVPTTDSLEPSERVGSTAMPGYFAATGGLIHGAPTCRHICW